jgi:hypothetical protein
MPERVYRKLSLLLIIIIGAFMGYFVCRTYIQPYPSDTYRLDFADSQTLAADVAGPRAFFRKRLYLPTKVRHAWMAVAASESFTLYLNGEAIGHKEYPDPSSQDIYDLSTNLNPGKNVIAIEVTRDTHPNPAWLRVVGGYTTWDGETYPIKSDNVTWKASNLEKNILRTDKPLYWYDLAYDDVYWNKVNIYQGSDAQLKPAQLKAWPLLYATSPRGNWLWGMGNADQSVHLERTLHFPFPGPAEVWVRISGLCPYRLTLNGQTVAVRAEPEETFDLINLKPLVRWGENRFGISVQRAPRSANVLPEIVTQIGAIDSKGLRTDSGWTLALGTGQQKASLPVTLAPYPSFPGFTLRQEPGTINLPWWYPWRSGSIFLASMGLTALLVLEDYFFWGWFWQRRRRDPYLPDRLAILHLPAGLFLMAVWLLGYDPRVLPDWPFQTWVIVSALGLLLAGQLLAGCFCRKNQP